MDRDIILRILENNKNRWFSAREILSIINDKSLTVNNVHNVLRSLKKWVDFEEKVCNIERKCHHSIYGNYLLNCREKRFRVV